MIDGFHPVLSFFDSIYSRNTHEGINMGCANGWLKAPKTNTGARELRNMQEIIRKMITEAMAAQHADVNQVKKKSGQNFVIDDTRAYVDAVKGMKPLGDQSKAVFALHTDSVNAHYTILKRPDEHHSAGGRSFCRALPDPGHHGDAL